MKTRGWGWRRSAAGCRDRQGDRLDLTPVKVGESVGATRPSHLPRPGLIKAGPRPGRGWLEVVGAGLPLSRGFGAILGAKIAGGWER